MRKEKLTSFYFVDKLEKKFFQKVHMSQNFRLTQDEIN